MQTTRQALSSQLTRIPCARCARVTAFTDEAGLCPACRCRDLEAAHGLRPGMLTDLALRSLVTPESRPRRAAAHRRRTAARVA